jgi:hypothetical protein
MYATVNEITYILILINTSASFPLINNARQPSNMIIIKIKDWKIIWIKVTVSFLNFI